MKLPIMLKFQPTILSDVFRDSANFCAVSATKCIWKFQLFSYVLVDLGRQIVLAGYFFLKRRTHSVQNHICSDPKLKLLKNVLQAKMMTGFSQKNIQYYTIHIFLKFNHLYLFVFQGLRSYYSLIENKMILATSLDRNST